jgi:NACHT domain
MRCATESFYLKVIYINMALPANLTFRCEETRDTINTAHITPLGSQHKRCLDGTRVDVINEITSWARAKENKFPVYCIGDVAGTGKSTIARTLVEGWKELNPFAFFFSQEGSSTRTAGDFCFFLKEQIQFAGGSHLDGYWKTLPSNAVLQSETVERQWIQLIQEPLRKLAIDRTYIIVVDALDECTLSTRGLSLECLLSGCSSGHLPHLRVLITTRKEVDIRAVLDREEYRELIRHKTLLNSANSTADVEFYVQRRLDQSGIFMSNIQERLRLISRCGGLFIFASLACKLLEDACSEGEPLVDILHSFTSLDSLYHQALTRADRRPEYTRGPLKNILGIILTAQAPLSVVAIAGLLSTSLKSVVTLVERLGSILSVGGINESIYILHATFPEFLLRQSWITSNGGKVTNEYALSKAQSNRLMAQSCLSVLFKELKSNICNLEAHSKIEHSGISRQDMWQGIPAALRYAALTWISHTIPELHHQSILDAARDLLRNKLLCWLEVGGIGEKLADYMVGIRRLQLSMERIRNKLLKLIVSE